jgi:hypothetical protein
VFPFPYAVLLEKATLYQKTKRNCFTCRGKFQLKFEKFAAESNCEIVTVNVVVVAVVVLVVVAVSLSVVRFTQFPRVFFLNPPVSYTYTPTILIITSI